MFLGGSILSSGLMFNVMCQRKCVYIVKEDISNTCYYLLRKLIFFFFFFDCRFKELESKTQNLQFGNTFFTWRTMSQTKIQKHYDIQRSVDITSITQTSFFRLLWWLLHSVVCNSPCTSSTPLPLSVSQSAAAAQLSLEPMHVHTVKRWQQ